MQHAQELEDRAPKWWHGGLESSGANCQMESHVPQLSRKGPSGLAFYRGTPLYKRSIVLQSSSIKSTQTHLTRTLDGRELKHDPKTDNEYRVLQNWCDDKFQGLQTYRTQLTAELRDLIQDTTNASRRTLTSFVTFLTEEMAFEDD
jgi:hypothetical protein